ncbi:hypothetical protein PSAC2689_50424 [Paraburkholderia sacchari]
MWSWGERIAIWLRPLNESNTDVEIVSKPSHYFASRLFKRASI